MRRNVGKSSIGTRKIAAGQEIKEEYIVNESDPTPSSALSKACKTVIRKLFKAMLTCTLLTT